jgi:hypothetical protein
MPGPARRYWTGSGGSRPEQRQGQAALLAYHYARSNYQDKAVAYALCAGDQATGLYASAEAATYYARRWR